MIGTVSRIEDNNFAMPKKEKWKRGEITLLESDAESFPREEEWRAIEKVTSANLGPVNNYKDENSLYIEHTK